MKNLTILKTISALALTSGIILSPASAGHRTGVEYAIDQVEATTTGLLGDYTRELKHRGLWKPRGEYHRLWVAIHRMEEYGDSLMKHHNRRTNPASLAKVVGIIDRYLHTAEDATRHCRVSSRIHADLKHVSAATHALIGYCNGGRGSRGYDNNDRGRGYNDRRRGFRDGRYADRRSPSSREGKANRRTFRF